MTVTFDSVYVAPPVRPVRHERGVSVHGAQWARKAGPGLLAGTFPTGITSVEGTPTSAEVTVRVRTPAQPWIDGAIIARVISAGDGTWSVTGLDLGLRYDVIGRYAGYNDVIMSDVTPYTGFPRFTEADDTRITDSGDARVSE